MALSYINGSCVIEIAPSLFLLKGLKQPLCVFLSLRLGVEYGAISIDPFRMFWIVATIRVFNVYNKRGYRDLNDGYMPEFYAFLDAMPERHKMLNYVIHLHTMTQAAWPK